VTLECRKVTISALFRSVSENVPVSVTVPGNTQYT